MKQAKLPSKLLLEKIRAYLNNGNYYFTKHANFRSDESVRVILTFDCGDMLIITVINLDE